MGKKMAKQMKALVKKAVNAFGYDLVRKTPYRWPGELDEFDLDLVRYIQKKEFTMVSLERLINTIKACKYVCENNIPGDFVECGVWRGGNGILAQKIFQKFGVKKKVWMYDTFSGMTEPSTVDVNIYTGKKALEKYIQKQRSSYNEWSFSPLEEVKNNCTESSLDLASFEFIQGDVCETLKVSSNLPEKIAVLRLDTDWYESTRAELENLYPNVSNGGVLIIDDYGSWDGSRKAVDEYFSKAAYKPLFNVVDLDARSAVKWDAN